MRAKQWRRNQIQAYGSLCTSGDRRPQGIPDDTLQVGTYLDPPCWGRRNRSEPASGLSDGLSTGG